MALPPTPEQIERDVKAAFADLDRRQMELFAQMTPVQRLKKVAEMCAALKEILIASERQMHPELNDEEIRFRAKMRILSMNDHPDGQRVISILRDNH